MDLERFVQQRRIVTGALLQAIVIDDEWRIDENGITDNVFRGRTN